MDGALQRQILRLCQQQGGNLRGNGFPLRYVAFPANNLPPKQVQCERIVMEADDLISYAPDEKALPGLYIGAKPLHPENNDYFEVEIIDCGLSGDIAVGLVPRNHPLDQLPGFVSGSLGYHSGDGKIYLGHQRGTSVAGKCDVGDRIGCGIRIDSSQTHLPASTPSWVKLSVNGAHMKMNMLPLLPFMKLRVFFTLNGSEIASSVITPLLFRGGLYPAVALSSPGEEVKLSLDTHWISPAISQGIPDDSMMCVDSYEDDWARLNDVRLSGCILEYAGRGKSILDVGLAQARRPLDTRYHYFEIEIIDPGESCYIAIGLTKREYPQRCHPGWNKGSIAYHADDGKIFIGSGSGDAFGPKCHRGDIMGCGIIYPHKYNPSVSPSYHSEESELAHFYGSSEDKTFSELSSQSEFEGESDSETDDSDGSYDETNEAWPDVLLPEVKQPALGRAKPQSSRRRREDGARSREKVSVFFTRNGKLIGQKEVYVPEGGFYPTVGMLSVAEKVKVDLHPLTG